MPPPRRILSLWFPRLAAERLLRRLRPAEPLPVAVVAEAGGMQRLAALTAEAEAAGLWRGQPLRDAQAICPGLLTRPADPAGEAAFLAALGRWAGQVSPFVAASPPDGLMADITGCAHLFGGEAALAARLAAEAGGLGLTLRAAIADTPGAAWALARFDARAAAAPLSGDAIRQEARATRSRAADRPVAPAPVGEGCVIVPPGQTAAALAPLPPVALRLEAGVAEGLARLGLRRIGDLAGLPRAALARRFGRTVLLALDRALGRDPEPLTPTPPPPRFALRMGFAEPIGREDDILAALERMLPRLCDRLQAAGRGARRLRLQAFRADGGVSAVAVGLARAGRDPVRMQALLALKLGEIDAGFGIDALRLAAVETEPLAPAQHPGPLRAPDTGGSAGGEALDDLIGRLGARLGMEAVLRLRPGDSHIPEKTVQFHPAAYAPPVTGSWAGPERPALLLARPEPLGVEGAPHGSVGGSGGGPPARFRWRRRDFALRGAGGPERLAPEWWLDDPDWRSGPRDYWRVETDAGLRLWLFHAHGGEMPGGWFCHGLFA